MDLSNKSKSNIDFEEYKKQYFSRALYGIFMGVSDAIPGYSGGTTLSLLGFYETLITRLKNLFKKNSFSNWFKNFLWLLPFLIFWAGSIFAFSFLSEFIVSSGFVIPLILLFFSFSLFCIPIFFYQNIWSNRYFFVYLNLKSVMKEKNLNSILWFGLGCLIIIGISLLVFFNGGIQLKANGDQEKTIPLNIEWLWISLAACLAGFSMLIPGISGESIFYMTNYYDDVFWKILQNPLDNILILILIGIAIVIGIILSILLTSYLLKKFNKNFLYFAFGLVCMSPLAILLGMFGYDEYVKMFTNMFINDFASLGLSIVAIAIGLVLNLILFRQIKTSKKKIVFDNQSILIMDDKFYLESKKIFSMQKKLYINAHRENIDIYYLKDGFYFCKKNKKIKYSIKEFEDKILSNTSSLKSFYFTNKEDYLEYKKKNIGNKSYQIF